MAQLQNKLYYCKKNAHRRFSFALHLATDGCSTRHCRSALRKPTIWQNDTFQTIQHLISDEHLMTLGNIAPFYLRREDAQCIRKA